MSDTPHTAGQPLRLFGAPVGLYTGKIRCYLRKQGIPFVERLPSDPVFQKQLLPRLKRFINPVVLMPDGELVQDTADIIDYLEASGRAATPSLPGSPRQRMVALILDLYGGEGLLRAAMHYRWSFPEHNRAFLRHEFGLSFRPGRATPPVVEQRLDAFMSYLNGHLPSLGINSDTAPAIEASYLDMLDSLDAHFREHPYALGGCPSLADYGLIAPLYAHLARDPWPCMLMKQRAPSVWRWTERMNAADADTPEFPRYPAALPQDDELPSSLRPVLGLIARDFLPELAAMVAALNRYLETHDSPALQGTPAERGVVRMRFELRGMSLQSVVSPYVIYKLQRVVDAHAALSAQDREGVDALLDELGLMPLLGLRTRRRIERREFLEVWGDHQTI